MPVAPEVQADPEASVMLGVPVDREDLAVREGLAVLVDREAPEVRVDPAASAVPEVREALAARVVLVVPVELVA